MKKWNHDPRKLPWFDQPDAEQILARRRDSGALSDHTCAQLENWLEKGYIRVSEMIDPRDIDEMNSDLESLWYEGLVHDGLFLQDIKLPGKEPAQISHAELMALDSETRLKIKTASNWRVFAFHNHSKACYRIFHNIELKQLCSNLMGKSSLPTYTINFLYGSKQHIHQDSAVFHIYPMNHLIGVWLAGEDIVEESGPLVFYPKSHKAEPFTFTNYPQVNVKNANDNEYYAYGDYINSLAEQYDCAKYLPNKGELFIWHPLLVHGGSEIMDPARTRKSYVCHYIAENCDQSDSVAGPFRW